MRHELATTNILAERYEVHSALGGRPVQANTVIYNRTGNHCRLFLPSRGKMPEYARSDDDDDSTLSDRAKNDILYSIVSQKGMDEFRRNLVDRLGV